MGADVPFGLALELKGKAMKKLLAGLTVGAAMLAGVSAAQAEPLKLTDPQMDAVTAAGFKFSFVNVADATAFAKAFGGVVNIAVTDTFAVAGPGFAVSSSSSSACSGICFN